MGRVVIKCGGGLIGTTVEIDGARVHGLKKIVFVHDAGTLAEVHLEMMPTEVVIEGDAEVVRVCICPACQVEQDELSLKYATARRAVLQIGVDEQPLNPEGF